MRPEDKAPYLSMVPRVFVRALRDPNQSAGEEYELSEGQATDLLIKREELARENGYIQGLRHASQILQHEADNVIAAVERAALERRRSASEPSAKGSEGGL